MSRSSHIRQMQLQQQQQLQHQQQMAENEAAALAAEMFDHFCVATTMRQVLGLYRNMCDTVGLRPGPLNEFYPKLKAKIRSWKAQALWKKFDARAAHRVYSKGSACSGTRVLVIGAGPCGLRTAIEAQLLGAKVVVVEKRDRISRNNVLHLWPFVITDLRNLGAKKFYGKFCAGSIDHISIRQLQCILLKVALLLGVEVHEGVSFLNTLEPNDGCGWRAKISPEDHAVSHYEFDVLIGADGKRNTLEGFKRKEFRGKLAIAITANFINKKTEAEAKAEEISGVAFIFNQSFFKELYATTGIDLENIVYYKDETHYFVMTAKKHSLIDKGVIMQDFADPAELLAPANVNTEKLLDYAREAAEFSTKYQMPNLEFAVNHYGKPDVAMFDFTSMFAAETSCRVIVRKNYRLLQCLVGDSLLEPFWPTGSGCARGFLSSMDAAFAIKLWTNPKNSILGVLAQRESIYRLLAQTTPENLHRDIGAYTVDPATRYPNLNKSTVNVWQVKHLMDTDDDALLEQVFMDSNAMQAAVPETPIRRKRRSGDTLPLSTVLLRWIKAQLHKHEFSHSLNEVSECFTRGKVLCALINRYRPDLVDLNEINDFSPLECNELAFKIFESELGIPCVLSAKDSINLENVDSKIWLNYLEQICEVFRGEIPHVKHPKLDFAELKEKGTSNAPDFSRLLKMSSKKAKSPMQDIEMTNVIHRRSVLDEEKLKRQRKYGPENTPVAPADTSRRARKRRSQEKSTNIEERQQRLKEIETNRVDRQNKRRLQRFQQTQNFYKSLHMLQANTLLRESDSSSPFEDYSIYLYRQQAPEFNDRVKELEKKLLYPDRERGIPSAIPRGLDENFGDRIKSMEQRITSRGPGNQEKKPKDLLRAIGKIESTDWNIREIEKKIEQSKKTETGKSREKVPKWTKEQFLARQSKMAKPKKEEIPDERFKEIDQTLKNLDKQLKDGSILEVGERGRNKVASIAGQFVKKDETSEEKIPAPVARSSSKVGLLFNKQAASEKCHFCKQTVYLMEKISTEGLILHRSCLKCHHCHTNLRLGGYAFDRDDPVGRFYCTQHFRLPAKAVRPVARKPSRKKSGEQLVQGDAKTPITPKPGRPENVAQMDMLDRGQTPERIEFENADALSDGEPSLENIIDENEWTDRNFISGSDDLESDLSSTDSSDEESDSDLFEEANGSPIGAQTLQLATDWIGKQRYSTMDDSDEDFYDSSEGLLDDDVDSQTEGEEFKKAREMRRQEVKLMPLPAYLQTDTETEVQTDSESSSPDDVELNSATEISTDSEFDHDPVIFETPRIFIDDTHLRKPTKVQIKQGVISNQKTTTANNRNNQQFVQQQHQQQEIEFKPLVQVDPSLLNSNRMPLKNPRPGDYLLNKTPSTEGIASKKSLELKKRYLLGEQQGIGNGIMKSGSTSILDSKLRSFHSNISECQKLLHSGTVNIGSNNTKALLDRPKIDDKDENKSSESSKKDSEKENEFIVNRNNINRDIKYSETVNTALVENMSKSIPELQLNSSSVVVVDTIDLISPEKNTVPIIDLTITTPSKPKSEELKQNQDHDQVVPQDVIDLTGDSPEKDEGKFTRSSEKPDVSKDVKEIIPDIITHTEEMKMEKISMENHQNNESLPSTPLTNRNQGRNQENNENDIQDTCIEVPTIPWEKRKSDVESDSLSSTSSSLEDIPHFILDSTTSPDTHNAIEQIVPRLEVHDSSGTLMQIDSLMIIDGKYVGDPEDLKLMEIPEGTVLELSKESENKELENEVKEILKEENKEKEVEKEQEELKKEVSNPEIKESLMSNVSKPDLKFDTKNENKINTLRNIPLILDKDEQVKVEKPTTLELNKSKHLPEHHHHHHHDRDKTPTAEQGVSDSETEITGQVLTETELSDWTADDAVSENFVDIEFALNSNKGTIKRNKKGSKRRHMRMECQPLPVKLSDLQPPKDCGILKNLDIEEIEFMDTGSEGSYAEAYAATNKALIQNRGYIEFIENAPPKVLHARIMDKPDFNEICLKRPEENSIAKESIVGKEIPGIDYIEQGAYILNNDIDLKTPVNEIPLMFNLKQSESIPPQSIATDSINDMDEDSLALGTSQCMATNTNTNTTTTEESETLTVVTSPLELPCVQMQNNNQMITPSSSEKNDKTISSTSTTTKIPIRKSSNDETRRKSSQDEATSKRKDSDEISYEEYVRKLQMKITQISNARDSIDVRKQKRKTSKGEVITESSQNNSVIENKSLSIFDPPKSNNIILSSSSSSNINNNSPAQSLYKVPEIPTLTRKLEEIAKEKTKQKDLIHDLVMDKLQSKKQLNAEKRLNRSRNRSLFSPGGQFSTSKITTNVCSSTPHYHLPSSSTERRKSDDTNPDMQSMVKTTKMSPVENKDSVHSFSTMARSRQRPLSDNLDQISLSFDTMTPRLSKTQSFCVYTKPTIGKVDSADDQRKQISDKTFVTPIPPPRSNRKIDDPNTDKMRAEARARARLKSNEDLGLSPEEKLQLLRKRYHLDLQTAAATTTTTTDSASKSRDPTKSNDMILRERKMMTSKSVNDISAVHKSLSSDDKLNAKSMEAVDFISDPNLSNPQEKTIKSRKRKDPERRKSLIQAVSSFFNKNKKEKESPSPPKEKEKSEGVFSRFRISPKSKEKSKEKEGSSSYERSNSQDCLKYEISTYSSTPQLFKTTTTTSTTSTDEVSPPPIPPLPTNYQRSDDESYTNEPREHKKQRAISKASRQAELKRLRIAQEIQREQEEIEVKLKELEARGVLIEKALRGEGQNVENLETSSMGANDEKLLKELLEIWRNITQLKKRDEELGIRQEELQLEHRHAQLKEELNMRLSCSKLDKSSADVAAEGAILNEMLEIVAKRAALRPNDNSTDRQSLEIDSDV